MQKHIRYAKTIRSHSIAWLSSYQMLILLQKTKGSIKNGLGLNLDMFKIIFISSIPNCPSCHRPSFQLLFRKFVYQPPKKHEYILSIIWTFLKLSSAKGPYILCKRTFTKQVGRKFTSWINVNLSAIQIILSQQNIWTCPPYKHSYFRWYI